MTVRLTVAQAADLGLLPSKPARRGRKTHTADGHAIDPAYLGLMRASLEERGLPMQPFPQDAGRMTRATETFQRLFIDTRVRHGNDRVLLDQIANIGTKPTERGVRISKLKSGRVDAPVALAMALDRAFGDELMQDVVYGGD